jgi:hypothetical protein
MSNVIAVDFKKRIQEKEYNGWTNWDTWNVNLWLTNDEWSYSQANRLCRAVDLDEGDNARNRLKKAALRELAEGVVGDDVNFDNVDWDEIITSFQEE